MTNNRITTTIQQQNQTYRSHMLRFKLIAQNNENSPKMENPKTRGRGHKQALE